MMLFSGWVSVSITMRASAPRRFRDTFMLAMLMPTSAMRAVTALMAPDASVCETTITGRSPVASTS